MKCLALFFAIILVSCSHKVNTSYLENKTVLIRLISEASITEEEKNEFESRLLLYLNQKYKKENIIFASDIEDLPTFNFQAVIHLKHLKTMVEVLEKTEVRTETDKVYNNQTKKWEYQNRRVVTSKPYDYTLYTLLYDIYFEGESSSGFSESESFIERGEYKGRDKALIRTLDEVKLNFTRSLEEFVKQQNAELL